MGLKQKTVSGVKWNTVSTVTCTLLQIIRLAVLTRLLERSDFGLIAIAMMVIAFTDIFSELGLTVAIIHKQDITVNQYSSIYWLNIAMSVVMFGLVWLVSPLLAVFYKEPILSSIIPLLGIQILLNGFGKMFQTVASKNMEFDFISKIKILSTIIGFVVTVIFAVKGLGIYSLVIGHLLQEFTTQGIFAIKGHKRQKLQFHFNYNEISDFVTIGTYKLGSQVLDFASSKIDVFLIGRFFGMDSLGIYNIAKDLIVKPYMMINSLVVNVAASAFAQIQYNLESVRVYFKKLVTIVSTISLPLYIIIFVFADTIVSILYAPSFAEVALFIRLLTIIGIEGSISSQAGVLQVSLGRTDIGFRWTVIRVALSTAAILLASAYTIKMVAIGQMIVAIISFFLFWYIVVFPLSHVRIAEYIGTFKTALIASLVIAIPIFTILRLFDCSILLQITLGVLFVVLYLMYYWCYNKSFTKELICMVLKK